MQQSGRSLSPKLRGRTSRNPLHNFLGPLVSLFPRPPDDPATTSNIQIPLARADPPSISREPTECWQLPSGARPTPATHHPTNAESTTAQSNSLKLAVSARAQSLSPAVRALAVHERGAAAAPRIPAARKQPPPIPRQLRLVQAQGTASKTSVPALGEEPRTRPHRARR